MQRAYYTAFFQQFSGSNKGQSTDNVQTESDRWVDRWTFRRSCWLVTFSCIEMKQIKTSMLFSCFSCYQYVASHCVLQNFDLKSWKNATIPIVYNSCIETDIRVHTLSVTKLKIFSLSLVRQKLFNGHIYNTSFGSSALVWNELFIL